MGAHDVLRLAAEQFAPGTDADPLVMADGVQAAVERRLQFGEQTLQDAGRLHQGTVGAAGGTLRVGALLGLGEQAYQGFVGQLEYLLQGADRPQGLGALRPPGALLPVTQARHPDLDPVARQMVLDALQRQSAGGDRGTQRDVERAAAQGRVQFRRADLRVRVVCAVPHAGAFL